MGGLPAFCLGACYGSFLNVLIHRLPRDESVISPRSRCPRCGKSIPFYDNIPILSWLVLRARCRFCGEAISPRYPLVEGAMGALALALWSRWPGYPLWVLGSSIAGGLFLAAALIDFQHLIIPDEITLSLFVLGLALAPINPLLSPLLESGAAWIGRLAAGGGGRFSDF